VTKDQFMMKEVPMPEPKDGEVLLKALWISIDPEMRGRMDDDKSYCYPFEVGQPFKWGGVAQVIKSNKKEIVIGSIVQGYALPFTEYFTCDCKNIYLVDPSLPLNQYIDILGKTGYLAWLGVQGLIPLAERTATPRTIVISGAEGPVGSVAVQLIRTLKQTNCGQSGQQQDAPLLKVRLIGLAATDDDVKFCKSIGYDEAFNYKDPNQLKSLQAACPDGIDGYFDNVGGDVTNNVYGMLNQDYARIAVSGLISFNNDKPATRARRLDRFRVMPEGDRYTHDHAMAELTDLFKQNKIKTRENVVQGFDKLPDAMIALFKGQQAAVKTVVKIADPGQK
jgi:NADPH-dependent curcumin reductase CurA